MLPGKGAIQYCWDDSCLEKFSMALGFSTEGFEGEILNLLQRMKNRRDQRNKRRLTMLLGLKENFKS